MATKSNFLGLDVGERRIGVATAHAIARLPRPLTTLPNDENFIKSLNRIIHDEEVGLIVMGLPRNLSGEDTPQTQWVRDFSARLQATVAVPVVFHDEALSSKAAKKELLERGKSYAKVEVDALAATYILDDYLKAHSEVSA